MRPPLLFLLAFTVFGIDQATKSWVLRALSNGHTIQIIPGFLQLALTRNSGAAFGLFQSSAIYLAVIAMLAVGGIIWYVTRSQRQMTTLNAVALALPLGGALGNLVDRLCRQSVVDFIDAHIGSHHFWIFNVADSAISIGVCLLLIKMFLAQPQTQEQGNVADRKAAPPDDTCDAATGGSNPGNGATPIET